MRLELALCQALSGMEEDPGGGVGGTDQGDTPPCRTATDIMLAAGQPCQAAARPVGRNGAQARNKRP
jgi:hypothetical protein